MAIYVKEVNMRSFSDNRAYHAKLRLDRNISDTLIINVFETLCNVEVVSIKDIREYKRIKGRSEIDVRDVSVNLSYTLNGLEVLYPKTFLPKVYNKHTLTDIKTQLTKIFGNDLQIKSFREQL